jgi:hypothetical protein
MAEEFNSFINQTGTSILETINPTTLQPDAFFPPNPNPPDIELNLTFLLSLLNIINFLKLKQYGC